MQVLESCPMWVLVTELRSSAIAMLALNTEPSSSPCFRFSHLHEGPNSQRNSLLCQLRSRI